MSNGITWSYTTACDALLVREGQGAGWFPFVSVSRVRITEVYLADPVLSMLTVSPELFSLRGELEPISEAFCPENHLFAVAI